MPATAWVFVNSLRVPAAQRLKSRFGATTHLQNAQTDLIDTQYARFPVSRILRIGGLILSVRFFQNSEATPTGPKEHRDHKLKMGHPTRPSGAHNAHYVELAISLGKTAHSPSSKPLAR